MLVAFLAVTALAAIPGGAIAVASGLPLRSRRTLATIPALSSGLVLVTGQVTVMSGVPFGLAALAGVTVVAVGIAGFLAVRRRRRRPGHARGSGTSAPRREHSSDHLSSALLGAAIGMGLLTWWLALRGGMQVPPFRDSMLHASLVRRILDSHSTEVARVVTVDADGQYPAVAFLQLNAQAFAALVVELSRAPIARVLLAMEVFFTAVVLPMGMCCLARLVVPRPRFLAGFVALAVPTTIVVFTTAAPNVPRTVSIALVPIAIVTIVDVLCRRSGVISIQQAVGAPVMAILVLLAVVMCHPAQLGLMALATPLLVVREIRGQMGDPSWRTAVSRLGLLTVGSMFVLAPTLPGVVSGSLLRNEQSSLLDQVNPRASVRVLPRILLQTYNTAGTPQVGAAVIVLVGIALAVRMRLVEWLLPFGAILTLTFLTADGSPGIAGVMVAPWFGNPYRVSLNVIVFLPVFAGLTLAASVRTLASRTRGRSLVLALPMVLAAYFGMVGVPAMIRIANDVDRQMTGASQTYSNDLAAAFDFLGDRVHPGETVVTEGARDGSGWLYPETGIPVLMIAERPLRVRADGFYETADDRVRLLTGIGTLGQDDEVDRLVERFSARWLIYSDRLFPGSWHRIPIAQVQANPNIVEEFRSGDVRVFRLVVPSRSPTPRS